MSLIKLKWEMATFNVQPFTEEIDASHWQLNDYCGWGNYYANLVWVYCIKNDIKFDVTENNQLGWKRLCEFIEVDYEKSIRATASIACEAINKLATLIYQLAFYCLKRQGERIVKNKRIYAQILICCGESHVEKTQELIINEQRCQEYLNKATVTISNLLKNICNNSSDDIAKEILDAINRYIGNNPLPDGTRHKLLDDYRQGKRCVAAYVFKQEKDGVRGYIAFSGFNDCEDQDILDRLSVIEKKNILKNESFIKKLVEISESLQFLLVIINKDVSIYKVPYNVDNAKIKVDSTLGSALASLTKEHKKLFSCSERKILTAFYIKTPLFCLPEKISGNHTVGYHEGTLYIQREPCSECCMGIKYEWEHDHSFQVIPQL